MDRDIGTLLREIAKVMFDVVAAPVPQRKLQPIRHAPAARAALQTRLHRRVRLAA